jgi:hypothetical protein
LVIHVPPDLLLVMVRFVLNGIVPTRPRCGSRGYLRANARSFFCRARGT